MCEVLDKIEARGEARGEAKGRDYVAENMIRDGEPVAKIQKYTDLTLKRLQVLSEKLDIALVM